MEEDNIKDIEGKIPENVMSEFNNAFFKSKNIQILLKKEREWCDKERYDKELEIKKIIEKIRVRALQNLVENLGDKELSIKDLNLSKENTENMSIFAIAFYIICDIMDYLVTDINALVQQKDKNLQFTMADKIKNLSTELKTKMSTLEKSNNIFHENELLDDSYDLYKEVRKTSNIVYQDLKTMNSKEH